MIAPKIHTLEHGVLVLFLLHDDLEETQMKAFVIMKMNNVQPSKTKEVGHKWKENV